MASENRHYKVAPEPLSEEARRILSGGRDEMIKAACAPARANPDLKEMQELTLARDKAQGHQAPK